MAKPRQSAAPGAVIHLVRWHWQVMSQVTRRALLPANSRTKVMLQEQHRAKLQLPGLRDSLLRQALEIPRVRVRVRQCLRGPGPYAFFREIPGAEKCNPAARYGDLPTSARCRRRCNRGG